MKTFVNIALAAALLLPAAAVAQIHPTKPESKPMTLVGDKEDVIPDSVYQTLLQNAPQAYNIPAAPTFAIVGRDHKFYLGIGGQAKGTLSYDFGHPIDNAYDFTTSAIPVEQAKGNGGLVQFSAATSGLFVNFVALPGNDNQVGVYLNANLTGNGNNYGFCLQYAYVKYRGMIAGYNYSLFSDMAAAPPSIDNEGPCGFTAIPNGVFDYTHGFGNHWSIGVGVEMPITSLTTSASTATVNQRVPDVPAYVQYAWGGGSSWLRFSAIMRNMQYRDLPADKNKNITGWGIKVSGSASPCSFLTAYWQAAYGKGITSYFQDLYEGGLDATPDTAGHLKAVKSWGGYLGLQYNLSPTVFATTTYSHVRNYADRYAGGATAWGDQYAYAQYALANVMWQITPHIQTGLEYIYGRRVNHDGSQGHDNRIQTMLCVTF